MPISRHVRNTRTAISPRFATRMRGLAGIVPRSPVSISGTDRSRRTFARRARLLTESSVAGAARVAGFPDGHVRFVAETGSTNADVLSLAEAGAPEWTTVVAAHQTSGRGRLGRSWASAPGASLLVSVLLRPPDDPRLAPLISLAAGVSTVMACALAGRVEARCKWPNDVVSGGRKLAGILAEARASGARMTHVVVGLGLNVTQRPEDLPTDLRETATSVATEGGVADHALLLAEYLG